MYLWKNWHCFLVLIYLRPVLLYANSLHGLLVDSGLHLKYCTKPAKHCISLPANRLCMGTKLPYTATSLDLTSLASLELVQEQLQLFSYLRYVPKCWAVIQPFLCSMYMPKCDNGSVFLPSREMCRLTLEPCAIFYKYSKALPKFNCEDVLFPSQCKNDVHELRFNTTGACMKPLVKTDRTEWFFSGVEDCGLQCHDSLYSDEEHRQIHKLISHGVMLCSICNLFAIMTFLIDWSTANKYPALTIFYTNVCFFIANVGWSIQFLGQETRDDIVCKKDGTLRRFEPSANENLSCVGVFVLVYYFVVAGMVWFVIFTYTWLMSSLQALGRIQNRVEKKRAYFHLVAWSLPLILTIATMALGVIDGDYVTGICFVEFRSPDARIGLLLTPLFIAITIAGYIIVKGLILLIKVSIDGRDVISEQSRNKIRSNIVRMGIFAGLVIIFGVITFIYHVYVFRNTDKWTQSLNQFIICKLTSLSSDHTHCKQEHRPSVAMLQLQLLAVFGAGSAMASWVWCASTLRNWHRYILRKFHYDVETTQQPIQKHQFIAQAFAKRKTHQDVSRLMRECLTHTDPIGLNFDYLYNSGASTFAASTTWAANIKRLVRRRDAINDMNVLYNHSAMAESEVSWNVRYISIDSRCNSTESQLSVKISEVKACKVNRTSGKHRYHRHHGSRAERLHHAAGVASLDRHLALVKDITGDGNVQRHAPKPNMRRRGADAGLTSPADLALLLRKKNFVPSNSRSFHQHDTSKDDIQAVGSVSSGDSCVSRVMSCLDVMIKESPLDLNDHLVMENLRKAGVPFFMSNVSKTSNSESEDDILHVQGEVMTETQACSREGIRVSGGSRRSKRPRPHSMSVQVHSATDEDRKSDEEENEGDNRIENEDNSSASDIPESQHLLRITSDNIQTVKSCCS